MAQKTQTVGHPQFSFKCELPDPPPSGRVTVAIMRDGDVETMKSCPDCGSDPQIEWRSGGVFHQRAVCICGRKTRWANCGHDASAARFWNDDVIQPDRDDDQ